MERGLLHVYTGNGKGKTSAAMGVVMRSLGYGGKVCVAQFMKGAWEFGEKNFLRDHPQVTYVHGKTGFSWIDTDEGEQREDALMTFARVKEAFLGGQYQILVLDELNIVLSLGYITLEDIEELLLLREGGTHVIVTGRDMPEALLERADLVTEMREIKHPFQQGIVAVKGLDY